MTTDSGIIGVRSSWKKDCLQAKTLFRALVTLLVDFVSQRLSEWLVSSGLSSRTRVVTSNDQQSTNLQNIQSTRSGTLQSRTCQPPDPERSRRP